MTSTIIRQPDDAGLGRKGTYRWQKWVRALVLALLAGLLVVMFALSTEYRIAESHLVAFLGEHLTGLTYSVARNDAVIYFGSPDGMQGIRLTLACSTLLLVVPVVLVSGLLALSPARSRIRLAVVTLSSVSLVVLANQARLLTIVLFTHKWGPEGLQWAHVLVGSLLMMLCMLMIILFYVRVLGIKATGRSAVHGGSGQNRVSDDRIG